MVCYGVALFCMVLSFRRGKKDSEERSKVYHSRVNMLFDEVVYLICIVVVMLNVYCEA